MPASTFASSSGDVTPVTSFTAENATEEHLKIQGKLDNINALLNEQTYDTKGVASLKVNGHERGLLELQRSPGSAMNFGSWHDTLPTCPPTRGAHRGTHSSPTSKALLGVLTRSMCWLTLPAQMDVPSAA